MTDHSLTQWPPLTSRIDNSIVREVTLRGVWELTCHPCREYGGFTQYLPLLFQQQTAHNYIPMNTSEISNLQTSSTEPHCRRLEYTVYAFEKWILNHQKRITLSSKLHLSTAVWFPTSVVQEPRAVCLKWMSTSGNKFEERKMFVACENLILKKILFHNAEISNMSSKMAANF